jgi:hypothetical protein
MLFYFMWQCCLRCIHQPAFSLYIFLRSYQSNMLPSTSSTLLMVLRRQASTYIYIRLPLHSLRNHPNSHLHTSIYVFSGPLRQSLTNIKWKRMHGYTSLIGPRLHSNNFANILTFYYSYIFRTFSCTNGKDDLAHLLPSFYVFSGPSLALLSRWQRVHGYTSLIRPRLHQNCGMERQWTHFFSPVISWTFSRLTQQNWQFLFFFYHTNIFSGLHSLYNVGRLCLQRLQDGNGNAVNFFILSLSLPATVIKRHLSDNTSTVFHNLVYIVSAFQSATPFFANITDPCS